MLDSAQIAEFLAKVQDSRLLVVGDVMLDTYIVGSSSRLSPEAPVPVLVVESETSMLGGAGNAFANITSFGAQASIIGVIGSEGRAKTVKRMVTEAGGNPDLLLSDINRPTTSKTRYMQGHNHLLRCDREIKDSISDEQKQVILKTVVTQLEKTDVLVLSDYGNGVLADKDFVQSLISVAQAKNIPVIIDPKGKDFSKYSGADFITPNAKELAEATDASSVKGDVNVEKTARGLIEQYGFKHVLATRSEDGISLISAKGENTHIPTHVEEVFDVSGAGDTVVAVFATMLATGLSPEKCAWLANQAGSVVVKKAGTSRITQDELMDKVVSV